MSRWLGYPNKARLVAGIAASVACMSAAGQQTDDVEVEEVVVTGSYLRGSPLDAPSPVQVVDRQSIEAQGAAQIWDVIKNLEVNSGSITNEGAEGSTAGMGTLSGMANVNLRNLGENSTLTLINGKRQVAAATTTPSGGEFVDLNTIPLVMVDRVEVLTDGGSALYGSDAVAGAVNVIMRTEFEGLELYGDIQGIEKGGSRFDKTASAIWGWSSDDAATHFVLSGETFRRDPVPVTAARFYDDRSEFTGSVGGMGTLVNQSFLGAQINESYINQDAIDLAVSEGGDDTLRYTDPLCSELTSVDGTPFFWGTRTSDRGEPSSSCREETARWELLNVGMERNSIAGALSHAFSEQLELYSFFQWSETDVKRSDSGSYSSRGPTVMLAAPGSHQGNPLVALGAPADYSIGRYAEMGSMAHLIGLQPPESIPNAPISAANGGPNVPMYANLQLGNTPRMGGDDHMNHIETSAIQAGVRGEFYALNNRRFNYDVGVSYSETSFELAYRTFQRDRAELAANGLGGPSCTPNGQADFDFLGAGSEHSPGFEAANQLGMQLGLAPDIPTFWEAYGPGLTQTFFPGFVFTTRESLALGLTSTNQGQDGCMFYNPFLTQMTEPELANQQELVDWMLPLVKRADKNNELAVFDAVVSGELFDLPGGMAQFAVGAQYRQQTNASIAPSINIPGLPDAILAWDEDGNVSDTHYVSNNYECSECIFNYDHDRSVKAVFTELSLPVINNVETQLALRFEDYGGSIGSKLTPKVALSWRPVDEILLRGSFSQSFRAPNIGVVQEGLEAGSVRFRDPISNQEVRAGLRPPTNEFAEPESTYSVGVPAPDVGNETADTFSVGFQWTPSGALEGFSLGADVWRFEVSDRVMPQPAISAIEPEIQAFQAAAQNPDNYVFNSSLGSDAEVRNVACNPNELEQEWGSDPEASRNEAGQVIDESRLDCVVDPRAYQVEGVLRATGSTTGSLITIQAATINAGEVQADGVDLTAGYQWNTDIGRFRIGSDFTYVRQYKLVDVPGLDLGLMETGLFDGAGTTGDGILVRSLPDLKGSVTLNWSSNSLRHSITAISRYVGSYDDLAYESVYENGNDYVRSVVEPTIDSYNSVDLQYNYVHEWANENLGTTRLTFGLHDAFNAELPFRYAGSLNYDASVFDGRGRRWYARVLMQF